MTDPEPSNLLDAASHPHEAGPGGTEQPNFIARSVTRVMRRTERALSPWIRRVWQSTTTPRPATAPAVQRRADGAPVASQPARAEPPMRRGDSFGAMTRTAALSSSPALTFVNRAQRKAEKPGVLQPSVEPHAALAVDRFTETVVRRFAPVAARYESRPLDVSGVVQRSELPFSGMPAEAEPAQPDTPAFAGEIADIDYAPIRVSPEESIAAQMASRLEAFRQSDWTGAQSPRQISRKAAQVAAARSGKSAAERPGLWRSKVEELGPRTESPIQPEESAPLPLKPVEKNAEPRETVQRKAAEISPPERVQPDRAQPPRPSPVVPPTASAKSPPVEAQPRAPALQREARGNLQDAADVERAGPRPDLPSISKLLTERFNQARMQWESEPVDDKPSFLRSTPEPSAPEPAVQRSVESPAQKPPAAPPQTPARGPAVKRPAPSVREDESKVEGTPSIVEPPQELETTPLVTLPEAVELPLVQRTPKDAPAESGPGQPSQLQETQPPPVPTTSAPQIAREPEPPAKSTRLPTGSSVEPPPAPLDQTTPTEPAASAVPPQPAGLAEPSRIQPAVDDLPLRTPQPSAEPPQAESLSRASPQILRKAEPEAPRRVGTVDSEVEVSMHVEPTVDRQSVLPLAASRTIARTQSADMAILSRSRIQRHEADEHQAELPLEAPRTTSRPTDSRPTQMVAVTQRPTSIEQRSTERPSSARAESPRTKLPLAPSVARVAERIQREETSTAPASTESTGAESQAEETPAQQSSINLQDLARRIYPIIKRMLAIERERR